uniref:Soluble calcium-activated nucleotidase 1 n=1 Tax=Chrysotila carterae TaxID=13221 RepID=A0A7S4BDA4_CHRCT|mmetsp:Transcript_20727/g.43748  ORF Transcript_20727/g.43748 Transcript_20727/m.43748 type:complete len:417 (+) Transcript_20727:309-1559(+)
MHSPSKYALLGAAARGNGGSYLRGGHTLPLFRLARKGVSRGALVQALLCAGFFFLVVVAIAATSLSRGPNNDVQVLSVSASPVMSDADALLAMYPFATASVPQQTELDASECERRYTLMLVADNDRASHNASAAEWHSALRRGALCRRKGGGFSVTWLDEVPLTSQLAYQGRGMELSTLTWFGGKLLACDDRTGVLFHIIGGAAMPAHILSDGVSATDATRPRSFKCEWASARHGALYVGGIGREWRAPHSGMLLSSNQNVLVLEHSGAVRSLNWTHVYESLRDLAGVSPHGYLTHEAILWDDETDSWLMLPRRASTEPFDDKEDEHKGANFLLTHSGHETSQPKLVRIQGPLDPSKGFSAARFLPGANGEIVALRTQEIGDDTSTFLSVIRTDGTVLMEDSYISSTKFEGLEVAV